MQVESFLECSAARQPGKTALVCGGRRLTYGEIDGQANRLAQALVRSGVERSDRVAIYVENSPEAVFAIFGALKANGIFLVINPSTKADKLAYILNNCRARALVTESSKLAQVNAARPGTPHLESVFVSGENLPAGFQSLAAALEREPATAPEKRSIDIDPAALIYTSGSTGRPKGVVMTHRNMICAADSIISYLENTTEDVILDLLPLAFDYGLYQLLMAFRAGATLVLERSFAFAYPVIELMIRERVTGLPIVPTMASILLQADPKQFSFPALRYMTNTAAALPTEHIRKLREAFPGARLYSMYGLTECKRVSYLPPEQLDIRPRSVGKAIPNTEVFVVDEEGRRAEPGAVGELVVRGGHVMQGYWEAPEETGKVLKPGRWPGEKVLYTGDLFSMDAEGYLYFVGRKDDIIKTRGEKVSPREVEEALYAIAGVVDAAVVGVPDEVLGQAIKAIVSVEPGCGLTAQAILRECAQRLEDFMVPRLVELRDSLPQTDTGKVSKRMLRASAGESGSAPAETA